MAQVVNQDAAGEAPSKNDYKNIKMTGAPSNTNGTANNSPLSKSINDSTILGMKTKLSLNKT